MGEVRAAADAITYAWGLTEQQWLDRVQSAVARADAAEARVLALMDDNDRLRALVDRLVWAHDHPTVADARAAWVDARAALAVPEGDAPSTAAGPRTEHPWSVTFSAVPEGETK